MDNTSPLMDGEQQPTRLEEYRRAILSRIDRLQGVLGDQFEVAVVFPLQFANSQSMHVRTIIAIEPDLLAFNGLLDNHTPATMLVHVDHLEMGLITRKRFEASHKAMTAFGFKDEAVNDWS